MLNPRPIVDAIVTTLKAIPALAAAMTENTTVRINGFHYELGAENRLAEAVYKMPAPSILVVWAGTQGGNFNGYQVWKHKFSIYYRMGNAAGVGSPVGYEDLWWLTCNGIPTGSTNNIRYLNLYNGLDIMDTPSVVHQMDEDMIDRFCGTLIIPEIGDQ